MRKVNIMHKIEIGNTVVAAGHHDISDIDPKTSLFEKEEDILQKLSPRKKSEWLGSREILFRISKLPQRAECLYDDFGKPFLSGIDKQISVSHSGPWASAMICDRVCGVDIQVYSQTIERIAPKFLSDTELAETNIFPSKLHHLHLLWGAKECIYKAYGKKKLEFREHIHIDSIDLSSATANGELQYEDIHLFYEIHYRLLPEAAWVFCIQRPVDAPFTV